ncbi:uncharacterized protein [Periplaneta americana]|uniref:uncharacterized protein n=1 Tax=Periplaneta americana TaxID=6978 RepID=UPI0037E9726C
MTASGDKRYLSEEEIDYLMNMSGDESEGEDPRNLCEIDEIHELYENQGTDHADKDADYVPSRGETSDSSDDDSLHNVRQDYEQPEQPADTSSTRAASLPLAPNVPTTRGGRGRGRGRNCSQVTNNPVLGSVETAADGTQWTVIPPQAAPGRRARQNIVTEAPGPTGHAKRFIINGNHLSAWKLLIDDSMLLNIKRCTEKRACQELQDDSWTISIEALETAISLLCM